MKNPALFLFLILAGVVMSAEPAGSERLQILDLRCEYQENPLAIESTAPRLSWRLVSPARGAAQTAWRILVASSPAALAENRGDLWDSGKVASAAMAQIPYAGKALGSRDRVYWKLMVWDEHGRASAWSEPAEWTMGLLAPSDWRARWISFEDSSPVATDVTRLHLPPAQHYRREFVLSKPVRRALVYASALGICDLHLNGGLVDEAYFQPGWSDYSKRAYYRAYDVTAKLRPGANALGAVVTDGWYAGYIGFGRLKKFGPNELGRYFYGKTPALLVQLEIQYADGTSQTVVSDEQWRLTREGPVREADLLMGEHYDARRELPGWNLPGYDDRQWISASWATVNGDVPAIFRAPGANRAVNLGFRAPAVLQAYVAPPIGVTEELPAKSISEPKPGIYLFDFGQNFAGNVRLRIKGKAGTTVTLRFGEMRHQDGTLMTENLRAARATDTYTLRGDPSGETWTPRFTYHGFQYAELTGVEEKPTLDTLTGLVLQNKTAPAGSFECSDPVLTRFALNAAWSQRANYLEVPTDCPQRDERLGWTGDAQTYVRTGTYFADIATFFTKWMDDLEEAQFNFGAYPDYAPYPMPDSKLAQAFAAAWGDAGIICPWTIWRVYGDTAMIRRHWASMTRFMDWRMATSSADGLSVNIGNMFGDWLNVDEPTPIEYLSTCYHAWDCRMMAEMADATGEKLAAETYRWRLSRIREAFLRTYDKGKGELSVDTQTAYALALWAGLIPEADQAAAARRLADKVAAKGNRLSTGFLGTRVLLPILSTYGYHDLAVRLFQNRQYPSWGYEVVNGATSVWERWDSYTVEGGIKDRRMNSFNHYALGAVMEWAYQWLAGIDTMNPGYGDVLIRPRPPKSAVQPGDEPRIHWVKAHYDSIRGPIATEWNRTGDVYTLKVILPANMIGSVWLPTAAAAEVSEGGRPLSASPSVTVIGPQDDGLLLRIGAGTYIFKLRLAEAFR